MSQPDTPQAQAAAGTPSIDMLRTLTLVAGLSGFLVVLAWQVTLPLIEENKRLAIERALFNVIPEANSRRDFILEAAGMLPAEGATVGEGTRIYAAYDDHGQLKGIAMEASAQGYQGEIRILYGYDADCECIRGIEVLKMAETPGIGDKIAKDREFQKNFVALDARLNAAGEALAHPIVTVKHVSKSEPWQIDAIAGATISSNAVGRMLNQSAQRLLPQIVVHLKQLGNGGAQ
jgi:electron transport complex protein RnfG